MKRLFSIFVLIATGFAICFAQKSYNSGQQAVRDNIMSYLREEGYQPSIDSDGDIKFKRQGDVYFVSVSDNDSSPYFVQLSKYFSYNDKLTKTKIGLYAQEINQYKMIKLIAHDNNFRLTAQIFLINSVAFTSIFDRILSAMDAAETEL